jgi:hypothetical protein
MTWNRDKQKAYMKDWHATHKDECNYYARKYRAAHKDEFNARGKIYRDTHKEEMKEYREVNKEKIKLQRKEHRSRSDILEADRLYSEKYRSLHKEEILAKIHANYKNNRDKILSDSKAYRKSLREKIFDHYGRKCVCCGETIFEFLNIDHINNDGAKQRKENKIRGSLAMSLWLIKNNYPDGFQTLCCNCNTGKYRNGGVCPHITNRTSPPRQDPEAVNLV